MSVHDLYNKGAAQLAGKSGWSNPDHALGGGFARIVHAASGLEIHGNPSSMYSVIEGSKALAHSLKAADAIKYAETEHARREKARAEAAARRAKAEEEGADARA